MMGPAPLRIVHSGIRYGVTADGQQVAWFLDQMGQMRMVPPTPGYKPPQEDMEQVNQLMEREFQRLGF
jgi:hypothetical protein